MPQVQVTFLRFVLVLLAMLSLARWSAGQPLPGDFQQELQAYERAWANSFWDHYHTGQSNPPAPFPYSDLLPDGYSPCRNEYKVFEVLFAHRLFRTPAFGQRSYLLDDLLRDDEDVRDAFELYTRTGILVTALAEPESSLTHLRIASNDGPVLMPGPDPDECWSYQRSSLVLSESFLISEGVAVFMDCDGGGEPEPAQPASCDDIPPSICTGGADVLNRWQDSKLWEMPYSSDKWFYGWNTIGFDCDDYADALASYLKNKQATGQAPADMAIDSLYLWYPSEGWLPSKDGHVVLRISIGDYYYVAEPQDNPPKVYGPYHKSTPLKDIDWTPISEGINKTTKPKQIDVRDPKDRPWNDPAPWYDDPALKTKIEESTGHPANDFICV